MADDFRRLPVPAEVNTFQAEVGCDQHFVTGRNSEDGTVVADSGNYTVAGRLLFPDVGNERFFIQRQAGSIYKITWKRRLAWSHPNTGQHGLAPPVTRCQVTQLMCEDGWALRNGAGH